MKIIHILCHSPGPDAYSNKNRNSKPRLGSSNYKKDREHYFRIPNPPYWAGFFSNDFHVKLATSMLENTREYDIECWRPYIGCERVHSKKINGITHRVFPSRSIRLPLLGIEYTPDLVKNLNEVVKNNRVVVHLHGYHDQTLEYILLNSNLMKVPVIVTQRGMVSPVIEYKSNPKFIGNAVIQIINSPKIDFLFLQSCHQYNYYSKKYGIENCMGPFMDGADMEVIRPIEKLEARKKLGIGKDVKMLFFQGLYDRTRGVDNLLFVYNKLKEIDSRFSLYMVGGRRSQELFSDIEKTDANVFYNRIKLDELLHYYSAADVFFYASSSLEFVTHTAFANALQESLACNTPIYTSQMEHFLGTIEEREMIGMNSGLVKDKNKAFREVSEMFDNLDRYTNCREICKQYYDRKKNSRKVLEVYKNLEERYY